MRRPETISLPKELPPAERGPRSRVVWLFVGIEPSIYLGLPLSGHQPVVAVNFSEPFLQVSVTIAGKSGVDAGYVGPEPGCYFRHTVVRPTVDSCGEFDET